MNSRRTQTTLAYLLLIVGCLSLGRAAPAQSRAGKGIPERIEAGSSQMPLWVSASSAESSAGTLDLQQLGLDSYVRAQTESPTYKPGDCISFGSRDWLPPPSAEGDKPWQTFSDLVAHSLGIFKGEITAVGPGFYFGDAGSLLQIRVTEVLKPARAYKSTSFLYVFYPGGEFEAAGYRFCSSDASLPPLPQVGDSILLLPYHPPDDAERQVVSLLNEELLLEHAGELRLPSRLQNDPLLRELPRFPDAVAAASELLDLLADSKKEVE